MRACKSDSSKAHTSTSSRQELVCASREGARREYKPPCMHVPSQVILTCTRAHTLDARSCVQDSNLSKQALMRGPLSPHHSASPRTRSKPNTAYHVKNLRPAHYDVLNQKRK